MTLPANGAMRLGADVDVELGFSGTTQISLGGASVRSLYNISSGAIRLAADGYNKSYTNIAYTKIFTNGTALTGPKQVTHLRYDSGTGNLYFIGAGETSTFVGSPSGAYFTNVWGKINSAGIGAWGYTVAANVSQTSGQVTSSVTLSNLTALPAVGNTVFNTSKGGLADIEFDPADNSVYVCVPRWVANTTGVYVGGHAYKYNSSGSAQLWSSTHSADIGVLYGSDSPSSFAKIVLSTNTGTVYPLLVRPYYVGLSYDRLGPSNGTFVSGALISNTSVLTSQINHGHGHTGFCKTHVKSLDTWVFAHTMGNTVSYGFWNTLVANTLTLGSTINYIPSTTTASVYNIKAICNDNTYIYTTGNWYPSPSSNSYTGRAVYNGTTPPQIYVMKHNASTFAAAGSLNSWRSNLNIQTFVGSTTLGSMDVSAIAANSTYVFVTGTMDGGSATSYQNHGWFAFYNQSTNSVEEVWYNSTADTYISTMTLDANNNTFILGGCANTGSLGFYLKCAMSDLKTNLTNLGYANGTGSYTISAVSSTMSTMTSLQSTRTVTYSASPASPSTYTI